MGTKTFIKPYWKYLGKDDQMNQYHKKFFPQFLVARMEKEKKV